jgi:DNA invertase Pin-like site-specific DNA recombinase
MMLSQHLGPVVRCAIYTRKSTDEGLDMAYNSLDAQRDAAEAYIRSQIHAGWTLVEDHYDDGAYSGGNMERPALKRLVDDIKAGKVQMVVVYKIDRLSRSLSDFAILAKIFEEHGASFTSVTEQFSTASALGRLHLNIILSFAQFERENSRERILDKVAASKKKGLWMGGVPPLGYDVQNRKLVVNEPEARIVKWIFQRYLEEHSARQILMELNKQGIKTKTYTTQKGTLHEGRPFVAKGIYDTLQNHLYVGEVHHKGAYYPGEHTPIIDRETWDAAQKAFALPEKMKGGRKPGEKSPSLLSGLIYCRCCRAPMTHTYTRKADGRLYRYYTSSAVRRGLKEHCVVGTVSASSVEETLIAQIRSVIRQPDIVEGVWQQVQTMGLQATEESVRRKLLALDGIWNELFPEEQRRIVNLLVKRVEMTPQGANIHMHANRMEELLRELMDNREEEDGGYDHCESPASGEEGWWTGSGSGASGA